MHCEREDTSKNIVHEYGRKDMSMRLINRLCSSPSKRINAFKTFVGLKDKEELSKWLCGTNIVGK